MIGPTKHFFSSLIGCHHKNADAQKFKYIIGREKKVGMSVINFITQKRRHSFSNLRNNCTLPLEIKEKKYKKINNKAAKHCKGCKKAK